MGKKGIIFNIQPFSIVDGPGIRTTVFLKGCNLRCAWCHNPESLAVHTEVAFYEEKCIGCENCKNVCENSGHTFLANHNHIFERKNCTKCGKCVKSCYSNALVQIGEEISVEELLENIMEDKLYYQNSNGGVTFSGGECMIQKEFLREALKLCKAENIHTAVDTAGNVDFHDFLDIMPYTDLFLYDIKAIHLDVHRRLTGVSNERIIDNFEKLIQQKAKVLVRVVYVPSANEEQMREIADYLRKWENISVEILGYHSMGDSKYKAMGKRNEKQKTPSKEEVEGIERMFEIAGIKVLKNRKF